MTQPSFPIAFRGTDRFRLWLGRLVARTLLVAYTLFLLKPVMPVLTDQLAHAFWKNVHIAVVHQVNGVEHVHYEVSAMAKDIEKEKTTGGKLKSDTDQYACFAATVIAAPASIPAYFVTVKYRVFSSRLPETYRVPDSPPPERSC